MGQYLDKFAGTIGKRQAEQILKLLNKQRNEGQIRTVQEFTQKLQSLMNELTANELKPSLSVWMAEQGEDTSSEAYNFMLDRVEDDLSAGFEEANNINEVQESHEAIIRDVILKNLRAGVAELESKISLFEFLNKDLRGFDSAIFSTFRETKQGRTQRQGSGSQTLFIDPRNNNVLVPVSQDADIELIGERLTLANDSTSQFHNISSVRQIFDSTTRQSELVVEERSNDLNRIIDNTKGTYWTQSLLFKERLENVKVKLEFSFGSIKEVNVVEVDPASKYGLILEEISYSDTSNVIQNLGITEQVINGPINVRFRKIATDRIILTFRNENPKKIHFQYRDTIQRPVPLAFQANRKPLRRIIPGMNTVSELLNERITSNKIKSVLMLRVPFYRSWFGYEFLSGLDNVRMGISEHEARSIYVSTPLKICGAGTLGLKTIESRPYQDKITRTTKFTNETYDLNQSSSLVDDTYLEVGQVSNTYFQGSIEYFIIKQDVTPNGVLSRTQVFPILPLDKERVEHERLVLNEKSSTSVSENDVATLLFYTTRTDGNIKVYRNGVLLEDQTDTVQDIGWIEISDTADKTPGNRSPMVFKIQVLDRLPGDIFTVSYTPVTSSTTTIPKSLSAFTAIGGLKVVDLIGDLSVRTSPGNVIILENVQNEDLESNIYLSIILRQNTAEPTLTPAVEEYTLVAGCKDSSKFEDL